MEDRSECQRITRLIVDAMQVSTDPVTAAGAGHLASLELESSAQASHLARCVAAFTTDDGLANEMAEIVGESPKFMIGKVLSVLNAPDQRTGEHADLEQRFWTLVYGGRRERSRVVQTLTRRCVI
jgi:hypothetical protein